MKKLLRTKHPTHEYADEHALHRCLTAFDLTLLGIGVIIGAGVFVLTGIAAATKAGPAISLSYLIAGLAAMFSALAYAELATSVGGCGSAYNYTYAGFGELIAWIVGWNIIFEYALAVSSVAIGWSSYMSDMLKALHIHLPHTLLTNPFQGGIINLPAMLIIVLMGSILCVGMKQSARFNSAIVIIKLLTITLFIAVASMHVNVNNWQNFFPFGWPGVMQGAALVFFAYIGFDALSTAAEETVNPQRNLPIGIIVSVLICSLIYMIVGLLLTGIAHYTTLNVDSPVASSIATIGYRKISGVIAVGAIAGLTTVVMVMYYGLTRICLAISRDGLLPKLFANVNSHTRTPIISIIFCGVVMALVAGLLPLNEVAQLVNIGTLSAFTIVCAGVVLMRWTKPEMPRPFKLPLNPLIPLLGVIFCVYLMLSLPLITWVRFIVWMVIGIIFYFAYGYRHSALNISEQ